MPADLPRNRLGFAEWLLRPEHPLTARVTVNRFWQEVFGTGIVRTAGDFGVTGELPSHPELLDWLAVDFRESRLGREAVLQADGHVGDLPAVGRHRRRRSWRKIRDNRLLVARPALPHGRRDGPRLRPGRQRPAGAKRSAARASSRTSPTGVWEAVAMIGSNTRDYKQDTGDSLYRRSMYTFWKRAGAAGLDGNLQRAQPRNLHRPPRAHQHAAAGAGHAERSAVRRGGAASGAARAEGRRQRTGRASISWPNGCWRGRCSRRN